jgi:hypothetical protein
MLAAMAGTTLSQRPDIVVERSARTMAARFDAGKLVPVHPRRGRYAVERWLLADGDGSSLSEAAKRTGWVCEDNLCRMQAKGKQLIWLDRKAKPPDDCKSVDIVISAEPLRRACGRSGKGRAVIDRFDVWRNGAHAIYVQGDGGTACAHGPHCAGQPAHGHSSRWRGARCWVAAAAVRSSTAPVSSRSAGATAGAANSGKTLPQTNDQ